MFPLRVKIQMLFINTFYNDELTSGLKDKFLKCMIECIDNDSLLLQL